MKLQNMYLGMLLNSPNAPAYIANSYYDWPKDLGKTTRIHLSAVRDVSREHEYWGIVDYMTLDTRFAKGLLKK